MSFKNWFKKSYNYSGISIRAKNEGEAIKGRLKLAYQAGKADAQQWRDIKDAPKKGYFLVKFDDNEGGYICSCFRNDESDFEFNASGRSHIDCNNPVGWMPIPGGNNE